MGEPMKPAETRLPLRLTDDDWIRRWMPIGLRTHLLHRTHSVEWDDLERLGGEAIAVCGRRGRTWVPGFPSRLGAPRCPKCCKLVGIPRGDGSPYNSKEKWRKK